MPSSRWFIVISIVIEERSVPVMNWEWTEIISGGKDMGKLFWNRWFLRWTFK